MAFRCLSFPILSCARSSFLCIVSDLPALVCLFMSGLCLSHHHSHSGVLKSQFCYSNTRLAAQVTVQEGRQWSPQIRVAPTEIEDGGSRLRKPHLPSGNGVPDPLVTRYGQFAPRRYVHRLCCLTRHGQGNVDEEVSKQE